MLRMTLAMALRKRFVESFRAVGSTFTTVRFLTPETLCVVVDDKDEVERDDHFRPLPAVQAGFSREGLDTDTLEGTAECARSFEDPPSDALLVESFSYYLRFDAFLPAPGAPDPPPWEEVRLKPGFGAAHSMPRANLRPGTDCGRPRQITHG